MGRRVTERRIVLIVEDEALSRMNVVQIAKDCGYEILESRNRRRSY